MDSVVGLPVCDGFDAVWVVVDRPSKMRHVVPCYTTIDAVELVKISFERLCTSVVCRRLLFRIEDLSLLQFFGDRYVVDLELIDRCLQHFTRPNGKFEWKRLGPFQVCMQVSPYAYELELSASIRIHRVQSVSLLDPVLEDPMVGQPVEPPLLVEVDGEKEYQV